MKCRKGCGACCIAISISSPIPGSPEGKPAGVRCIHLTENNTCALFGKAERPAVCTNLVPTYDMCGDSFDQALEYITELEKATTPD